jgi:phage baseplate assembly protein W
MLRHDYAFPFRISGASGQAAQSDYEAHVEQMIRQVLLTDPGERVNMPEFGCGLRRLLFAPLSDALSATTKLLVRQALGRWLSDQVEVKNVEVSKPGVEPGGELHIDIAYVLIETRAPRRTQVRVR